jgi:hypothetical protein
MPPIIKDPAVADPANKPPRVGVDLAVFDECCQTPILKEKRLLVGEKVAAAPAP